MSEHREERRVVTALLADVMGSTPLAEQLEPEEFKLVVQGAVWRVIGAVESRHRQGSRRRRSARTLRRAGRSRGRPERAIRAGRSLHA